MAGIERQELVDSLDALQRQRQQAIGQHQTLLAQIHAIEGGISIVEGQLASLDAKAQTEKVE
jgi:phage shock protein A